MDTKQMQRLKVIEEVIHHMWNEAMHEFERNYNHDNNRSDPKSTHTLRVIEEILERTEERLKVI